MHTYVYIYIYVYVYIYIYIYEGDPVAFPGDVCSSARRPDTDQVLGIVAIKWPPVAFSPDLWHDPQVRCLVGYCSTTNQTATSKLAFCDVLRAEFIPQLEEFSLSYVQADKRSLMWLMRDQAMWDLECVQAVLQRWRIEGVECRQTPWVYRAPRPLDDLLMRGQWHKLVLWPDIAGRRLRHRVVSDLLDQQTVGRGVELGDSVLGAALTAHSLEEVGRRFASLVPVLRDMGQRLNLNESVRYLGDMADALRRPQSDTKARLHGSFKVFHALLLAKMGVPQGKIKQAITHACNIVLDPTVSSSIFAALEEGLLKVPSAPTLSRRLFTFDMALNALERDRYDEILEEGGSEHTLSDSSPLLSTNWQLTESYRCRDNLRMMDVSIMLENLNASFAGKVAEDWDVDAAHDYAELSKELHTLIEHHMFTAVGLGSRAEGLTDKFHAIVHQYRLPAKSMASAERRGQRQTSMTSDLGTEAGLQAVPNVDLSIVFPYWTDLHVQSDDEYGGTGEARNAGLRPAEVDGMEEVDDHGLGDSGGPIHENLDDESGQLLMEVEDDGHEIIGGTEMHEVDDNEVAGSLEVPGAPDAPESTLVLPEHSEQPGAEMVDSPFFSTALPIAGILHIFHNALANVGDALQNFDRFLKMSKVLITMLVDPWTKQRLIKRCFNTAEARDYVKSIEMMTVKIIDWRFGTLIVALQQLQFVENGLRRFWRKRAYLSTLDSEEPGAEEEEVRASDGVQSKGDVNIADEAIEDPWFWDYGYMIMVLVYGVLFEAQNFLESCQCHGKQVHEKDGFAPGRPYFARRQEYIGETGVAYSTCPRRGHHAPTLANGWFTAQLQKLISLAQGMLLRRTARLSPEQRDQIVLDWEAGKKKLVEVLESKFAYWQCLPHRLCGLGSSCEEAARECLQVCFQLFAQSADNVMHHPLVLLVCHPAGRLYGLALRFLAGESLRLPELKPLRQLAARLRAILVLERSIEAKHRINKLASRASPHAGGAFVNVSLKLPDFLRRLHEDPQLMTQLLHHMNTHVGHKAILQSAQLTGHPTVLKEIADRGHLRRTTAMKVVYRLDPATQHKEKKAVGDALEASRKEEKKRRQVDEEARVNTSRHMLSAHALQQFRKVADKDAYYSITFPPASFPALLEALHGTRDLFALPLPALSDAEARPALLWPGDPERLVAFDDAEAHPCFHEQQSSEAMQTLLATDITVFSVANLNPSKRRMIRPVGSNLSSEDVSIALHEALCVEKVPGGHRLLLSTSGVATPIAGEEGAQHSQGSTKLLTQRHLESIGNIMNDFLKWRHTGTLVYRPRSFPEALPLEVHARAADLLTAIVACGATEPDGSKEYAVPVAAASAFEDRNLLSRLSELGLVTNKHHAMLEAGNLPYNGWVLTRHGCESLRSYAVLHKATPALAPRPEIKNEDKTIFEQVLALRDVGWRAMPLPRPLPPPYEEGGDRVWYYKLGGKKLCHAYLLAFLQGHHYVQHGRPSTEYGVLVGKKQRPRTLRAVEDDGTGLKRRLAIKDRPKQRRRKLMLALEDSRRSMEDSKSDLSSEGGQEESESRSTHSSRSSSSSISHNAETPRRESEKGTEAAELQLEKPSPPIYNPIYSPTSPEEPPGQPEEQSLGPSGTAGPAVPLEPQQSPPMTPEPEPQHLDGSSPAVSLEPQQLEEPSPPAPPVPPVPTSLALGPAPSSLPPAPPSAASQRQRVVLNAPSRNPLSGRWGPWAHSHSQFQGLACRRRALFTKMWMIPLEESALIREASKTSHRWTFIIGG